MKTLITTLLIFASAVMFSQTKVSVLQDLRLATIGDDKGNNAFTPNFTLRVNQRINGDRNFDFLAYAEYEHADLAGGSFNSAAVGFGLNFFTLVKNVEFQSMYGIGRIFRHGEVYNYWDLTGQIGYKLNDKFTILAEMQRTARTDISKYVYNGSIGLRYKLF